MYQIIKHRVLEEELDETLGGVTLEVKLVMESSYNLHLFYTRHISSHGPSSFTNSPCITP